MEGIVCILNHGERGCAALAALLVLERGLQPAAAMLWVQQRLPGLRAEAKEHLPRLCRWEREAPETFSLGAKPVSMHLVAVSVHLVEIIAMAIEMCPSLLENKHFVWVWTWAGSICTHRQLSLLPQALNFLWLKWSQAQQWPRSRKVQTGREEEAGWLL